MVGGGWTVAFSGADKSKEARAVINVPKWPRVTSRPSPVTALKRGHLHDHPSRRRTETLRYKLSVSVCVCVLECVWIKLKHMFRVQIRRHTHSYTQSLDRLHISQSVNLLVIGYTWKSCTSVPFHSL